MKTPTKKQVIIGSCVVVLLAAGGITGGIIHHNSVVHANHVATEHKAYTHQLKQVKDALMVADKLQNKEAVSKAEKLIKGLHKQDVTTFTKETSALHSLWKAVDASEAGVVKAEKTKADADVKNAQKLVDQLKDKREAGHQTALKKRLSHLNDVIKQEASAKKAVSDYQKAATDQGKLKAAQTAVNALKDPSSQTLKNDLNKQVQASQKQADTAKAAQESHVSASQASQNTASQGNSAPAQSNTGGGSNVQAPANTGGGSSYQAPASSGGGASYQAPASNGGGASYQAPSNPAAQAPASPAPAQQAPSQPAAPATQNGYTADGGYIGDGDGHMTQAELDESARHPGDWSSFYPGK